MNSLQGIAGGHARSLPPPPLMGTCADMRRMPLTWGSRRSLGQPQRRGQVGGNGGQGRDLGVVRQQGGVHLRGNGVAQNTRACRGRQQPRGGCTQAPRTPARLPPYCWCRLRTWPSASAPNLVMCRSTRSNRKQSATVSWPPTAQPSCMGWQAAGGRRRRRGGLSSAAQRAPDPGPRLGLPSVPSIDAAAWHPPCRARR